MDFYFTIGGYMVIFDLIDEHFNLILILIAIIGLFGLLFYIRKEEKIEIELIKGEKSNVIIYSQNNCKYINYNYYCWED